MNKLLSTSSRDFWSSYSELCYQNGICPFRNISKSLKGTVLNIQHSSIRFDHWAVFLNALSIDDYLTTISLCESPGKRRTCSSYVKYAGGPTKRNEIQAKVKSQLNEIKIGESLKNCIERSCVLRILKLEYFPLTLSDVKLLANVLSQSTSLNHLSLKGSLDDKKVKALTEGLKDPSSIYWVDFSDCILTLAGLRTIMTMIKHQSEKRQSHIWEQSLRYAVVDLDAMKGIRRVTLNNVKFGDVGAKILADALIDDFWMKAIDVQNCDIKDDGAVCLEKVVNANCILEVLDLRFNYLVSDHIQDAIIARIQSNNLGKTLMYEWSPRLKKEITTETKTSKKS